MAAHATVTVETPDKFIADLRAEIDQSTKELSVRGFIAFLKGVLGMKYRGMVRINLASAVASKAVTCDQSAAVDATDTITIAGTALAVVASPATTAEFAKGASSSAMATNLANCINANPTLQKIVRAKASSAVCTIYCLFPGAIGNLVTLAETGSGMAIAGGATALSAGSADEMDSYEFGYDPAA